jgi:4-carboxymuconolactone decarboxylase
VTARLEPPDESSLTEEDRALCAHLVETRGWLPNVFAVGLHSPELMRRVADIGTFFRFDASLDPVLRELVILAVAKETGSTYEWTHHVADAERLGVRPETLERLVSGELEKDPGPIGAAVRFARLIAGGLEVDAGTFDELTRELGARGTYELATLVAFYVMLSRLIGALGVPLEEGVSPRTPGQS